jgi:hypothetical protein
MRLVDDWRRVLARAWSVRLLLIGAGLSGLAGVWFALVDAVPLWLFIVGGVVLPMLAVAARLVAQPKLRGGGDADQ